MLLHKLRDLAVFRLVQCICDYVPVSLFQPPDLCNNNCVIFDLFQSLSLFQLGFVSTPEYDTHALHYPSVTTVLGGVVVGTWGLLGGGGGVSSFLYLARGPSRCSWTWLVGLLVVLDLARGPSRCS